MSDTNTPKKSPDQIRQETLQQVIALLSSAMDIMRQAAREANEDGHPAIGILRELTYDLLEEWDPCDFPQTPEPWSGLQAALDEDGVARSMKIPKPAPSGQARPSTSEAVKSKAQAALSSRLQTLGSSSGKPGTTSILEKDREGRLLVTPVVRHYQILTDLQRKCLTALRARGGTFLSAKLLSDFFAGEEYLIRRRELEAAASRFESGYEPQDSFHPYLQDFLAVCAAFLSSVEEDEQHAILLPVFASFRDQAKEWFLAFCPADLSHSRGDLYAIEDPDLDAMLLSLK